MFPEALFVMLILKGADAMKYIVLIHKDASGNCWGECPELPGCFSQGNSPEDLMGNMREAIELYLREPSVSPAIDRISEVRELVV